jgi:hypothetical protein
MAESPLSFPRAIALRCCVVASRPSAERLDAEIMIVDNDSTDPATLHLQPWYCRNNVNCLLVVLAAAIGMMQ